MNININFDGRSLLLAFLFVLSIGAGAWGVMQVYDASQTMEGIEELKTSAEEMKNDPDSVSLLNKLLLGAVGMGMQLNPQLLEDLENGARSQRRIGLLALLGCILGASGVVSAWRKRPRDASGRSA